MLYYFMDLFRVIWNVGATFFSNSSASVSLGCQDHIEGYPILHGHCAQVHHLGIYFLKAISSLVLQSLQ